MHPEFITVDPPIIEDLTYFLPLYDRGGRVVAHTLVDLADQAFVDQWEWHRHQQRPGLLYAYRSEGSARRKEHRRFLLHRELLGITDRAELQGDHRNRNGLDNRRCNLRIATQAQNQQNTPSRKGASSQFRGVNWDKSVGKWRASARLDGVGHTLGYFGTELEAAIVASEWRRAHMPFAVEDEALALLLSNR